jgi:type IV pilus assembly protein PilC
VIPTFKDLFKGFGADLPAPTQIVMNMSDWFVANWFFFFGGLGLGVWLLLNAYKRSVAMQNLVDRMILRAPIFGDVLRKASIARWCRTLSTMFAAGVPLVEALESVAGAAGNFVYYEATKKIQQEVSSGTGLTVSMQNTGVFPSMVLQMTAIGEESGALDQMLSKVADFFEAEVDEAVDALASLMEPLIMVVLGGLIGGLVVAMYLPIFKMGTAV